MNTSIDKTNEIMESSVTSWCTPLLYVCTCIDPGSYHKSIHYRSRHKVNDVTKHKNIHKNVETKKLKRLAGREVIINWFVQ